MWSLVLKIKFTREVRSCIAIKVVLFLSVLVSRGVDIVPNDPFLSAAICSAYSCNSKISKQQIINATRDITAGDDVHRFKEILLNLGISLTEASLPDTLSLKDGDGLFLVERPSAQSVIVYCLFQHQKKWRLFNSTSLKAETYAPDKIPGFLVNHRITNIFIFRKSQLTPTKKSQLVDTIKDTSVANESVTSDQILLASHFVVSFKDDSTTAFCQLGSISANRGFWLVDVHLPEGISRNDLERISGDCSCFVGALPTNDETEHSVSLKFNFAKYKIGQKIDTTVALPRKNKSEPFLVKVQGVINDKNVLIADPATIDFGSVSPSDSMTKTVNIFQVNPANFNNVPDRVVAKSDFSVKIKLGTSPSISNQLISSVCQLEISPNFNEIPQGPFDGNLLIKVGSSPNTEIIVFVKANLKRN